MVVKNDYDSYFFNNLYNDELIGGKLAAFQNRLYNPILKGKEWIQNNRIINGDIFDVKINQDLNMSPGKIGAHTAHAVFDFFNEIIEDGLSYQDSYGGCDWDRQFELMKDFKCNGDTIVVLKAHEKDLLKWEEEGYVAVRDRGYTEVKPDSITAVNLGIYDKDQGIPKFIQRLRLL